MKKVISLFICIGLLFSLVMTASVPEFKGGKNIKIDKYEVVDLIYTMREKPDAPFEVDFYADFTSPKGDVKRVYGFYNGDSRFVLRFSASVAGEWTYITGCEKESLAKKKGRITVSDSSYKNSKGTVLVDSDNRQRFIRENGDDFFMLGFECDFLYALNYHNSDSTPELDQMLEQVKKLKFNYMIMNVYGYNIKWEQPEVIQKDFSKYVFGAKEDIFPFLGSNSNPDYSSLNIEFFEKLDRIMMKLHDRDIVSHLMIYVWSKMVAWPELDSVEGNRYFDYVVKRYSAFPNLVWDISKEALGYKRVDENFLTERLERLRNLDPYDRLVSVHDYRYCAAHPEKVDFIIKQDWGWQFYAQMLHINRTYKDKPSFNIEMGGYEQAEWEVYANGNYVDAETCLRRNYESLFAGVYSAHYWQGTSWNVIVYDWFKPSYTGYKPKFEYYTYMADFFERYPFSKFKPNPSFNSSGYCLYDGDGTYLMYIPKESRKAEMWKMKALSTGSLSYRWFNTITGEYTPKVELASWEEFNMPAHPWFGENDAIFVLESTPKKAVNKPRLVVTTDINIDKGDPDDRQSLAHLFLYSNDVDIQAIIIDRPGAGGVEAAQMVVEAYRKDYNNETYNFRQQGYPHPDTLKNRIYTNTQAADLGLITKLADQSKGTQSDPLYVAAWGNVKALRTALEANPDLVSKLRVLSIATDRMSPYDTDTDSPSSFIRNWNDMDGDRQAIFADSRFNELWWVENNWGYNGMFDDAMGVARDYMIELQKYGELGKHITDCTASKEWAQYFRIGDTPTIMYFIENKNLDNPLEYNLGGYFTKPFPESRPNYYIDAAPNSSWDYSDSISNTSAKAELDARAKEMTLRRDVMYDLFRKRLNGLYLKLNLVGAQ